ncbi:MAG: alpha/beta hydrolase [Proteobacteria bacterium]|nr:alpha/beta hydrolase [Pseudomonadota bacterium]
MPLHPQAALAIEAAGDLPAHLSPVELRRAYSEQRIRMLPPAPPISIVRDVSIPSPDGPVAARFYSPDADSQQRPLLVYFHGGGWMLGSVDSYDTVCRRLAIKSNCAVLSVDYRLAPETTFPGAVTDAYAATLWAAKNAADLRIDAGAIAVGGDSAGGNLAAVLAQMSRDSGEFHIALQVLIYPCTDMSREYPSYVRNASGYMLTRAAMNWFISTYVPHFTDRLDTRASPMLRPNLAGLARALIISAEFDPLVDDNATYALRLRQAGVPTRYECFPGMHHPFFTLGAYIDDAAKAEDMIAAEMKALVSGCSAVPPGPAPASGT